MAHNSHTAIPTRTHAAVMWAHSLSQTHPCKTLTLTCPGASHPHTKLPRPHTDPRTQAHDKGATQMHVQTTHTITGVSVHKRTSPTPEKPPAQATVPQPSILANTAQACPISSIHSLAQDRPCPACPNLLGWGPACSQCQLPAQHRAQCPVLLAAVPARCQLHPLLLGLPPQHLGPSLGSTQPISAGSGQGA